MLNTVIIACSTTSNIINACTAIGTIGAVIVGIFGTRIRAWFEKPKLKIDFKFNAPNDTEEDEHSSSDQKHHKREYCIEVANSGKSIAKSCLLIMDELYKQRRDGNEYVLEKNFFSAPLRWFGNTSASSDIRKKMSSYVNWLSIIETPDMKGDSNSSKKHQQPNVKISMALHFANNRDDYSFSPGTYIFEIKTCADNVDPISRWVEIYWDPSCTWQELNNPRKFKIKTIDKKEFEKRCGGAK